MAQNLKVSQPYANAFIQMISGKDSLDKVTAIIIRDDVKK
jgi:hypothetical protein